MNEKIIQTLDAVLNNALDSLGKKRRKYLNNSITCSHSPEFLDNIVSTIINTHSKQLPDGYASYYINKKSYDINKLTPLSIIRFLVMLNDMEKLYFNDIHAMTENKQIRQSLFLESLYNLEQLGFNVLNPLMVILDEIGEIYSQAMSNKKVGNFYDYLYHYDIFLNYYQSSDHALLTFEQCSKIFISLHNKDSSLIRPDFFKYFISTIKIMEDSKENNSIIDDYLNIAQSFYHRNYLTKEKILKALIDRNLNPLAKKYFPEFINDDIYSNEMLVVESFKFNAHALIFKNGFVNNSSSSCFSDVVLCIDKILTVFNNSQFLKNFNSNISNNPVVEMRKMSAEPYITFTLNFSSSQDKDVYKQLLDTILPLSIKYLKNNIEGQTVYTLNNSDIEDVIKKAFLYINVNDNIKEQNIINIQRRKL